MGLAPRCALALATLAAALVLAAPATGAQSCGASTRAGAKVVERTRDAVVFTRGERVSGCLASSGRVKRLPLGSLRDAVSIVPEQVVLAGR